MRLSVDDFVQNDLFGTAADFFIYQKTLDIDAASRDRFAITADSSASVVSTQRTPPHGGVLYVVINARICKTEKTIEKVPSTKFKMLFCTLLS